jgi:hypothetical protein
MSLPHDADLYTHDPGDRSSNIHPSEYRLPEHTTNPSWRVAQQREGAERGARPLAAAGYF